jgi:hypothetical protein
VLLCCFYLEHAAVEPAMAQQDSPGRPDSSAILGQLTAWQTHEPIRGALVEVVGTRLATTTDSSGHFALTGVAPGVYVLKIRAIAYAPRTWRLALEPREVLTRPFELQLLPYQLPEVVVKGKGLSRFADFERRRQSGMGYFLTKEQIERRGPATLVDLLVMVRGVEQVCLSNDCVAKMVRSPPGCYPQYFLDGYESTPYFARHTPPGDIQGVEIYRGSSEIPGEFIGSNSGCGVIAIWTKSAP